MRWKGRLLKLTLVVLAGCTFDPNGLGGGGDDVLVDAGPTSDARTGDGGPDPGDGAPVDDATILVDATPVDAAPPDAARCVGYVASGTSKYRAITTTRSWVDAEHGCEADGAHLAVLDNEDESTRVGGMLSGAEIWIGLSDRVTEGSFITVTGTTPYLPWSGNQPDDFFGEDCVVRYGNGRLNDADCSDIPHAYVCECDGLEVRAGSY